GVDERLLSVHDQPMRRVTPRGFAPRGVSFGKASHAQIANPLARHRRPLAFVPRVEGERHARLPSRNSVRWRFAWGSGVEGSSPLTGVTFFGRSQRLVVASRWDCARGGGS